MSYYFLASIFIVCFLISGCGSKSASQSPEDQEKSPQLRLPGEQYEQALGRYLKSLSPRNLERLSSLGSVKSRAISFEVFSLKPEFSAWRNNEELLQAFNFGQNRRFLVNQDRPHFLRRISWLYPDDGCYARGELMNALLEWRFPALDKVFVFGPLKAETLYSPTGYVDWWYHTALVAAVAGEYWVLDPALHGQGPLLLRKWLDMIMLEAEMTTIAICSSLAYVPHSSCQAAEFSPRRQAFEVMQSFLKLEWNRLDELGRDPLVELGDKPPWSN